MARAENRAEEDCNVWMGWGLVERYESFVESGHCQSESRHKFEIENKTNKQIGLRAEYSHTLQRHVGGGQWEDIDSHSVEDGFSVEAFQSYGYTHWGKPTTRNTFADYIDGSTYRLYCYTAVRGEGGSIEAYKYVPTIV